MLICRNWIDTLEDDYTSCGQGMFRLVVCWRFGPKTILSSESRRGSEINELRSSGQRSGPRRVCEPWGQQYPIDSTSRGAARFFRRSAARRPLGASTQGSQTRLGPERCPLLRSSLSALKYIAAQKSSLNFRLPLFSNFGRAAERSRSEKFFALTM